MGAPSLEVATSGERGSDKAIWLQTFRQVSHRLCALERDCWQVGGGRGVVLEDDVKRELEVIRRKGQEAQDERAQYAAGLRQQLKAMRQALTQIHSSIRLAKRGIDSGETLQAAMEGLEQLLMEFKRTRRQDYEELLQQERLVSRELQTYVQHFNSWSQGQGSSGAEPSPRSNPGPRDKQFHGLREEKGDCCESEEALVERINLKIAREGGATGGWHPQEHDMFLQMWAQVRGSASKTVTDEAGIAMLQDRCAMLLKDRSASEVKEHLLWYLRYQQLIEEKRLLIKRWRAVKEKEKAKLLQQEESEVEGVHLAKKEGRPSRNKEREEKKQQLEAWKETRAQEKAKEEEERRAKAEEEKRVARERERRRNKMMREQVALYKMEKRQEEERQAEVEKLLFQAPTACGGVSTPRLDLDQRARETIEKAKKKREEIEAKTKMQQQERVEKQQKMLQALSEAMPQEGQPRVHTVYRDPDRVIKATTASKVRELTDHELEERERARSRSGAHERAIVGHGRDLVFQGRAVPAWRSNLVGYHE